MPSSLFAKCYTQAVDMLEQVRCDKEPIKIVPLAKAHAKALYLSVILKMNVKCLC